MDGVGNGRVRSGQAASVFIDRPDSLGDVSGAVVKRAYRYRFYPTHEQAVELSRTFGCVRLVYNRALDIRTTAWSEDQRRVGYADT